MSTMYLWMAILVAIIHFAWILIVSIGSLLAILGKLRKMPTAETIYLGVVGLTVLNRIVSPDCWLTKMELYFRKLATGASLSYGFIEHGLGLLGVSLERGALFVIGATWISAGLFATLLYHAVDMKQATLVGGQS